MSWRWIVLAAAVTLVGGGAAAATPVGALPKVKAPAAIVVDAASGRVLYAKREHMRRPIASTTKIMTALVAMEHLRPNDVVVVTRKASRVPYGEGLKPGERVPAWKLYYGLLLASANDTAVALAEAAGGTRERFLRLMNEKARALGLRHTHYRSASGLIDEGNYSTVHDLAMLTRYALGVPRFRAIVATRSKRVWWRAPTHAKVYENHNKLLWRYHGADGVKTGWTRAAGRCLVASATRHGIRLIAVVLDSPDHYKDTTHLLDYGFRHRG
ncbi:MAG TPA: D-alanyl-D-alanine carboxypeptidase family protein [Gaiellaceae bacterium]|nr:D-alanyl-D-alanine carboxypeptidase family protein [Gaiellaceae bacterium]